ncbi:hypothetical protein Dsin_014680 [Dipteronia sinensis]|uniref:Uncharacterized protein n=1 Tax=Dipteronia sinensis TaxID=43782 RepID=A0AAE0ANC7_9ROSI|nr:hypothetical protein Dsin_014680 [Dipteronia sinensis]
MEVWRVYKVKGSIGQTLFSKLKACKNFLKAECHIRKSASCPNKEGEERLQKVNLMVESDGWTDALREEILQILFDMWKVIMREEQKWGQKPRVKWLKDGDKKLKFFHHVANGRIRSNCIGDIMINGL